MLPVEFVVLPLQVGGSGSFAPQHIAAVLEAPLEPDTCHVVLSGCVIPCACTREAAMLLIDNAMLANARRVN